MQFLDINGVKRFKQYTDDTFITSEEVSEIEDASLEFYTKSEIDASNLVTSAALNDLNDRISDLEQNAQDLDGKQDTLVSGVNIKTINGNSLLGEGNLSISGADGGEANVIESVKVNGTAISPDANKAVNITVPTNLSDLTDDVISGNYLPLSGGNMNSNALIRLKNDSFSMVLQPFGLVKESNEQSHQLSLPDKNGTIAITRDIPTKTSDLTNDSGFITDAGVTSVNGSTGDVTIPSVTENTVSGWGFTKNSGTLTEVTFNGTAATVTNGTAAISATIPTETKALNDKGYISNGTTVDSTIAGTGFTTNKSINDDNYSVVINSSSQNPFLELKQGSNKWYAQAANDFFYFGPTSTKALRIDQNGNGVFTGTLTASSLIKNGGTSSQFLKADGSVDSNAYALASNIPSTLDQISDGSTRKLSNYLPLTGGTLSGDLNVGTDYGVKISGGEGTTYVEVKEDGTVTTYGCGYIESEGTRVTFPSTDGELALVSQIPTVPAVDGVYLPLTGGNLSGNLHVKRTGTVAETELSNTGLIVHNHDESDAATTTYGYNKIVLHNEGNDQTVELTLPGDEDGTIARLSDINNAIELNVPTTILINGRAFSLSNDDDTYFDLGSGYLTTSSLKTVNSQSVVGSGNISINEVPSYSSANNGQILSVVNGALAWITPAQIYSGSGTPSNTQGNNGDIYLQS